MFEKKTMPRASCKVKSHLIPRLAANCWGSIDTFFSIVGHDIIWTPPSYNHSRYTINKLKHNKFGNGNNSEISKNL